MAAIPDSNTPSPSTLVASLLKTVEERIIPLTQQGVSSGSKVFGAAILSRENLKTLTVASNNERVSPLLHGEINCIQQFFTVDFPNLATRPDPRKDCIFFATHEPCSLCLSGITWSGFSEIYYLFTYEDSRDLFSIPYDIEILQEVFRVKGEETQEQVERRPLYNRTNKFFRAKSLADVVSDMTDEKERQRCLAEIKRVKDLYNGLSETYQEGKRSGVTTSSVWK
ncbi:cytidine deaminase-like protein [Periconia macrospinosa]|uniref:Cytidine deaminase-like protein n=1 Tax=Periconia macrospinosa TaxID=97972 RepID=A0A2V1DH03_9PLEO|nr:cytidine deaminase-like protein [Periconia macrospinosa]